MNSFFKRIRCDCEGWYNNWLFLKSANDIYDIKHFIYCPYCGKKMKRSAAEWRAAKILEAKS